MLAALLASPAGGGAGSSGTVSALASAANGGSGTDSTGYDFRAAPAPRGEFHGFTTMIFFLGRDLQI